MKARIHLAALMLLAIMLAGCSRDGQSSSESITPAATDAATAKQLKKPLAKGVALSFAYHLRRDRVEEVKPEVFRRRIRMEYLGMDQQQAADALAADMSAAGYEVSAERLEDGRDRLVFQKGKQKIRAFVRHGGKLQNPEAKGVILVEIPAKAPSAKKDAARPAGEPATDKPASA